ncbi:MAG: type II secretion system F family protein [Candidatus Bathyarchaeota archaeon]|nr:type II secretion system F family protein [Candidatus Bathyarchaeota archaeon]MDH5787924.1 type II secretion system F family protein [Candidatus Bathyarchaeota archaeon]
MRNNKALVKLKTIHNRLMRMLRLTSIKLLKSSLNGPRKSLKPEFGRAYSMVYQLFGERTGRILPLFKDLDQHLQKSGLKVNFKAYVSLTIFATILVTFITFVLIPVLLIFAFNTPLFSAFLFGVGGCLFASVFSVIGFYIYPVYRADMHRRELDDELPFTTGYMAILSSAGVSPEKIFFSLSNLDVPLAASYEAKNVFRNVNLFGLDIISALEKASSQTPSERFSEMLEGLISTVHSGSNLAAYLREKSRQSMKLKRINLKKFSDTLSMLSEFYVALLLTGPLLLVIMLTVTAMLGGGSGILSPDLLLSLLTYLGIPIGAIVFLIILDATSPKW